MNEHLAYRLYYLLGKLENKIQVKLQLKLYCNSYENNVKIIHNAQIKGKITKTQYFFIDKMHKTLRITTNKTNKNTNNNTTLIKNIVVFY